MVIERQRASISVSGDEKNPDDVTTGENSQKPAGIPPKAAFSDDFDDPLNRSADELPDDEPLTPELVEEEAIRGDFMLRWATIFLALLMAFGQLNDTKPLVLIKSGDYMRSHGFLPPRTDQFSMTMEGQPVTNLSWVFDHVVSLCWLIAGVKGLTLLKVLVAGLSSFLLVRVSIPGVSTWWSSICAIFAVIACSSDYLPLPELATIAGMTLTMHFLAQHRLGTAKGLVWKLPVLMAVWCNLDSHAWVGAGVVAACAVGTGLSGKLRNRSTQPTAEQSSLALPAVLCFVALLINPFPLGSLLSPLKTYSVEYPALQSQRRLDSAFATISFDGRVDAYSVLNPSAVVLFDHSQIAGLAVMLMAFVVLILARSSRDLGFLFSLLFMTGLVLLAAHEIPAAAIVAAVVAGISAQDWYRRSFNMKYSTETRELLWSRGGRALTVGGLALIGFCVVAARLPGAMPLGFGFDPETQVTIDSFSEQLKTVPESARVLHTRIEQGDLMIWNGRKSFVDSRVLPFGRPGDPDSVFGKHANVLSSLLQPPPDGPVSDDPQAKEQQEKEKQQRIAAAKDTVNEYEISHVITRLAPPGPPDYASMRNLAGSGEWIPVNIGASAAILERLPPSTTEEMAVAKFPKFMEMAFRDSGIVPASMRQFASPPTFYEKYVYRHRAFDDLNKRFGRHYGMLGRSQPRSVDQILSNIAVLTLAIRHLNVSLAEQQKDAEKYVLLGQCYGQIGVLEEALAAAGMPGRVRQMRYQQAVVAFRQATLIDPENLDAWDGLFQLHARMQRIDLALECLDKWLELAELKPPASGDQYEEFLTQRFVQKRELEDQVAQSDERLAEAVKQQSEEMKKAAEATKAATAKSEAAESDPTAMLESGEVIGAAALQNTSGRPRKALQTLNEKSSLVRSNVVGSLLLGQLLLETGEPEEAHRTLALLSSELSRQPDALAGAEWQLPTAVSQLAVCDYTSAAETWGKQLTQLNKQVQNPAMFTSMLFSLPMVADVNYGVNDALPVWPFRNSFAASEVVQVTNELRAEVSLLLALVRMEEGLLKDARTALARVISEYGDTSSRTLASAYFSMVDEKPAEFLTANSLSLWEEFEYPGEVIPAAPDAAGTPTGQTPAGQPAAAQPPATQNSSAPK